ncbi:MAG: zinc ribbon domain-containing protein [Acidobacteriota bacterium]|nr:zinc ribbon domain-containing protein [Acidobacteriota bacterium]
MPIYEYGCDACGKVLEVMQKFSDEPLKTCPDCSGQLTKLISRTSFQFKGTGWYVTDYARKPESQPKSEGESKPAAESKPGAEAKSGAESKPVAESAGSDTGSGNGSKSSDSGSGSEKTSSSPTR